MSADRLTPGHRATDHRRAAIAVTLARWHVTGMRRLGWDDPAWIARENIAWTISDEAEGAGP